MRPFFSFDKPVVSARQQLDAAGFPPVQHVIISHSHWDHASGVLFFIDQNYIVPKCVKHTLCKMSLTRESCSILDFSV